MKRDNSTPWCTVVAASTLPARGWYA